ncbi:MAG: outer membrane beta-barrel protein [Verrucomicrobiia bacterium]
MTNRLVKPIVCVMVAACAVFAQDNQQNVDRNVQNANANLQGVVNQHPFSYGLTLRESYDSNIYTRTDNVKGSFSTTASPDFQFAWSNPTTDITAHYSYSAVYYQSRPEKQWDQSHNLNVSVGHDFSPRLRVVFNDEFAPGFEPDIEEGTSQRSANYIQNSARMAATYRLNSRWDISTTVRHYFINYDDDSELPVFPGVPTSETMNRQSIEASAGVNYQPVSTTTLGLLLGYNTTSYSGEDRDNAGQTVHFSLQHTFTPRLSFDMSAGVQMQTFDVVGGQSLNPDVNMGVTYMLTSRTSLSGRFSTHMQPTEVATYLEQQTFMLSGSVVHQFTSKLMGAASVMYVPSEYNGSLQMPDSGTTTANQSETSLAGSLMLGYQFNVHLRGEVGYSYTHFTSDFASRSYDRHLTYLQARLGF